MQVRSDVYVELLHGEGSDDSIVRSALVSSQKNPVEYNEAKKKGLIRSLIRQKHGSPTESGYLEFYIEAPRGVRDEHVRHRIGSYSSTSLRYNMDKEPVVYIPPNNRPLKKAEDFKAMRPTYDCYSSEEYEEYHSILTRAYESWYSFDRLLVDRGFVETEARRWITEDGLYVGYIARFNPRSMMHFLGLRTHEEWANHVSFPMWEIEQVARQMETIFAERFPITHEAFNTFGREAP
jgi:thymidylate synthase (FAD)